MTQLPGSFVGTSVDTAQESDLCTLTTHDDDGATLAMSEVIAYDSQGDMSSVAAKNLELEAKLKEKNDVISKLMSQQATSLKDLSKQLLSLVSVSNPKTAELETAMQLVSSLAEITAKLDSTHGGELYEVESTLGTMSKKLQLVNIQMGKTNASRNKQEASSEKIMYEPTQYITYSDSPLFSTQQSSISLSSSYDGYNMCNSIVVSEEIPGLAVYRSSDYLYPRVGRWIPMYSKWVFPGYKSDRWKSHWYPRHSGDVMKMEESYIDEFWGWCMINTEMNPMYSEHDKRLQLIDWLEGRKTDRTEYLPDLF
jgi:hypothetical protein